MKKEIGNLYVAENAVFSLDCFETKRNNNLVAVGSAGSGKTTGIIYPNLYYPFGSYVISDPKGNLYKKFKNHLEQNGYEVHQVDFIHPEKSETGFNFLNGLNSEHDIFKMALTLVRDVNKGCHAEAFWNHTSGVLLSGVLSLVIEMQKIGAKSNSKNNLKKNKELITKLNNKSMMLQKVLTSLPNAKYDCNFKGINDVLNDISIVMFRDEPVDICKSIESFFAEQVQEVIEELESKIDCSKYSYDLSFLEEHTHEIIKSHRDFGYKYCCSFCEGRLGILQSMANNASEEEFKAINDAYFDILSRFAIYTQMVLGLREVTRYEMYYILKEDSFGLKQIQKTRNLGGSEGTFRNILVTTMSSVGQYDIKELNHMMEKSYKKPFDFTIIGKKKTALFVNVSDTTCEMDHLANILYNKIISDLVQYADDCCDGTLPEHVRLVFDDFGTNIVIPDFPKMISSFRSRNISATIMLQSESQLQQSYKKDSETILSSCDTYVYLGSTSLDNAKSISERVNKPLQDIMNLDNDKVWVLRRGERPKLCKKFNYICQIGEKTNSSRKRELDINIANQIEEF